jgi:4-amino-4-deoxy-L-arabinose transferase-like glycosyltransferase
MSGAGRPSCSCRLLLAALLVFAVLGFGGLNPYLPGGGDNAEYIAQAEALATLGHRADLHLAGAPTELLKPPLFPWLLAGVYQLFGRNVPAFKALVVLFGLGAVWAAWWLFRAVLAEPDAGESRAAPSPAGLAFWFALAPTLALYSHDVLSDVPFAFLALLAFGCAARAAKPCGAGTGGAGPWPFLALLALLVVATLVRASGLILSGACAGFFLLEAAVRRREPESRRLWVQSALLLVLALALFFWLQRGRHTYFGSGQLFRQVELPGEAGSGAAGLFSDQGLLGRLLRAGRFYALYLGAEAGGYLGFWPGDVLWIIAAPVVIAGCVTLWRRGQRLAPVCWALYQGALLVWPFLDARFYLPVLPLYLCLLWVGARTLFEAARARSSALGAVVVFVLALCPVVSLLGTFFSFGQFDPGGTTEFEWLVAGLLLAVLLAWLLYAPRREETRAAPARLWGVLAGAVLALAVARSVSENVVREHSWGPAPAQGWAEGWQGFYDAAQWLKEHAQPGDTVVSAKPSLVWFWSGLAGVPVPGTKDLTRASRQIENARWAVVDDLREDAVARIFLLPALESRPGTWTPCWQRNLMLNQGRRGAGTLVFRNLAAPAPAPKEEQRP